MNSYPHLPRLHLFEFCDLSWCPSFFRTYVQQNTTLAWSSPLPFTNGASLGSKAAELILEELPGVEDYTFIDPCAGAGGPVAEIERAINGKLRAQRQREVRFVLSDLYPAVEAWKQLSAKNENIDFVAHPMDVSIAPRIAGRNMKECRVISNAFHHLPDPVASTCLKTTIKEADGFIILEFVNRDLLSILSMGLGAVTAFALNWLLHWRSPAVMFWTYLVPLVPVAWAWEGVVSCLRARTEVEMMGLLSGVDLGGEGWLVKSGFKKVVGPMGLHWSVGYRRDG